MNRTSRNPVSPTIAWADTDAAQYGSFLLVGKPKSGKTTFAGSFPNPVIIDTDKGLASIRHKHIPTFEIFRDEPETPEGSPTSWLDIREIVKNLRFQSGPFWDALQEANYVPQTLIIDSLSSMCDILEAEIVANPPGKSKDDRQDGLQLQDYNVIQRRALSVISLAQEITDHMHFVATSGIDFTKDSSSGVERVYEQPMMTGTKLGNKVAHYFNDVYLHFTKKDKSSGKTGFYLTPVPSRTFEHPGSRWGVPFEDIPDPSYEKMKAYYYPQEQSS